MMNLDENTDIAVVIASLKGSNTSGGKKRKNVYGQWSLDKCGDLEKWK